MFNPGNMRLGRDSSAHLRGLVGSVVSASLGERTHVTYATALKHWTRWCRLRHRAHFLTGHNPKGDEDELVNFVVYKAMVTGLAHGTLHVMLHALRRFHLMERFADTLAHRPMLTIAMKGISRLQGGGAEVDSRHYADTEGCFGRVEPGG